MPNRKARLPLRQPPRPLTTAAMSATRVSSTHDPATAAKPIPTALTPPVKPHSFIRRYWAIGVVMVIGGLIAGCSALSSDTVRVVQSNADGTIAAMNNTMVAMQSTDTILQSTAAEGATFAQDSGTFSAQAGEYIASLQAISSTTPGQPAPALNASPTPPAPATAPVVGNGNTSPIITLPPPPPAQIQSSGTAAATVDTTGLAIDQAVLTRQINNLGCAVKPVTTFTMSDSKIYVVAQVHKLKKGVTFTATWSGTIQHEDTWTADRNAPVLCVHFYVDPNAINMAPGQWTVALATDGQPPQTLNFTIADTSAATAAAP